MANSTVYKVVMVKDGKKISAMISPLSNYCLTYEVGKLTVPAIGKIFAFDSIFNAKYMAGHQHEIWEASGENASRPTSLKWRLCTENLGKNIRAFWGRWLAKMEDETSQPPSRYITTTYRGTLACDSIALRKQVF